jgi:hypothetical protein
MLNTETTVWNHSPCRSDIRCVPLRRIDNRIRELCFKVLRDRKGEPETGLSAPDQPPQLGRCQRSAQPDGRPFWSFTWQYPRQNIVSQRDRDNVVLAQEPESNQPPPQAA